MENLDFNLLVERLADIGQGFPDTQKRVAAFREDLDQAWANLISADHAYGLVALFDLITEITKDEYQITDYTLEAVVEDGQGSVDFQIKSEFWSIPLLVGNFYKALVEMGGENFVTTRLSLVDDGGIPRQFDVILQYTEKKSLSEVYGEVQARNKELEERIVWLEEQNWRLEEEKTDLDILLDERNAEINQFLDQQAGASL